MRMLTPEMLYALLHGLPAEHLDFLEPAWQPCVHRIEAAVKQGADPVSAVKTALDGMTESEKSHLSAALSPAQPVMDLPDLTRSQKETLIALRSAGVVSVPRLSRLLQQDQDNVRKRLRALVVEGYVIKFHHPNGFRYFAAPRRIDPSLKTSVHEALKTLLAESAADGPANLPELPHLPELQQ